MKGERIIAEFISLIGLVLYMAMLQHVYSQMLHQPDASWLNKARAWWVTRRSRARIVQLHKIWGLERASTEPTPGDA